MNKIIILLFTLLIAVVHSCISETNNKEGDNGMDAANYLERGLQYSKQEKFDQAIVEFTKVIELKPDYAEAYYNRGLAKSKFKDSKGALADYDKAIELNPKHALAYYKRGNIKYGLQDLKAAITDYDKSIEFNPKHAESYINRATAKLWLQDINGAISDGDKGIELNPKIAGAYVDRGFAKYCLGNYKSAIADYDKGIELDSKFAFAYTNRGAAKEELKDYHGAIADYEEAIKLSSDENYKASLQKSIDEAKNKPKDSICQSCAMPMEKPEHFGTNADGGKNNEYCCYCFQKGNFTAPNITMEQMIDKLVGFAPQMNMTNAQAREMAKNVIPKLKRWKKDK